MQVQSLGVEDHLEEEMATHPSILGGIFHEQRRLMGFSSRGLKERITTEQPGIQSEGDTGDREQSKASLARVFKQRMPQSHGKGLFGINDLSLVCFKSSSDTNYKSDFL